MRAGLALLGLVAAMHADLAISADAQEPENARVAIVSSEFIFKHAPFRQSHASTIAETKDGLVSAWFGGKREKSPDVGIWLARRTFAGWSVPVEVANGLQGHGERYPCWNPVLFQPQAGPLMLFYKVGPEPSRWWGMLITSGDGGRTWSVPKRLPEGIIGPSKNKPIVLADGTIVSPSSSEREGWKLYIERSTDRGRNWSRIGPVADASKFSAIQPTLLAWPSGKIQLLARSKQGRIVEGWSRDGGLTWSHLRAREDLPNPDSGIDAVMLRDGRAMLVYNPARFRRSPLSVAISSDGLHWQDVFVLENGWGEYSYPAVIQTADGLVHITYTWKRERIRHVVIDPARLDTEAGSRGNK
jgi:predicted neuraminidase